MSRLKINTDLTSLKALNVNITDVDRAQRICDLLWEEIVASQDDEMVSMGLAAPQAGINARIAVLRTASGEQGDVRRVDLINPVLVSRTGPIMPFVEACMSIPEGRHLVPRFVEVVYNYDKIVDGKFVPATITGSMETKEKEDILFCQALQHEYDHLEGILITDYTPTSVDVRIQEVFHQLAAEQEAIYKLYHTPIKRDAPKIGRNELCPCGSKKKYKRCCLGVKA